MLGGDGFPERRRGLGWGGQPGCGLGSLSARGEPARRWASGIRDQQARWGHRWEEEQGRGCAAPLGVEGRMH